MEKKKLYHFSYVLLCLSLWQTLIYAQTPTPPPAVDSAETLAAEVNLIHAGDLIDVDVVGSLEYDWRGTLSPEGFLDGVDSIENPIYARCRSEAEVAAELAKAYGKTLRDPKVVVKILDRSNRPLAILSGAVKIPQRFQIKRPIYLNELLIVSGGLTDNSSGEIQIYRPPNLNCRRELAEKNASAAGNGENREKYVAARQGNGSNFINIRLNDLLSGKKEANPQILSGDIVTVQQAESIYVVGGVSNPRQISSRNQLTLTRAIASAGGAAKNADARKITIYRRAGGATTIIEADLEAIKNGKAEDVILKPFDIIEVAQNGRARSKFPPLLKVAEANEKNSLNFPLRIID